MKDYLIYALYGLSDFGAVERCLRLLNQKQKPSREQAIQKAAEVYGVVPIDVCIEES